jgi:hypothetical protein
MVASVRAIDPVALLGRHIRGELPLGLSFWLGGILQAVFVRGIAYAVDAVMYSPFVHLDEPYFTITYSLLFIGLAIPIFLIWAVGAIRSAMRTGWSSRRWVWPGAAIGVIVILTAATAWSAYLHAVRPLNDAILYSEDDPEWGIPKLEIRNNGSEIVVEGAITLSLASRFQSALESHGNVKLIRLDSTGGRLGPAIEIKDLVQLHHLGTVVDHQCDSACTIIFLGGRQRQVGPTARIGFHSGTVHGFPSEAYYSLFRIEARKAGVSDAFVRTVSTLGAEPMWYPTYAQLKASGFVTGVTSNSSQGR